MNRGNLYSISAPSGAGKTSLIKCLLVELDKITVSISYTTRSMHVGEVCGQDYFFISVNKFNQMLAKQAFLEHALVFDNFYGTTRESVEQHLKKGIDVILEIDWQGAQQIKKINPDCISIFVLPPSIKVLKQRLESRGRDSEDVVIRRIKGATKEISHCNEADFLIVNADFDKALVELKSIIICHRLTNQRQQQKVTTLLSNLI